MQQLRVALSLLALWTARVGAYSLFPFGSAVGDTRLAYGDEPKAYTSLSPSMPIMGQEIGPNEVVEINNNGFITVGSGLYTSFCPYNLPHYHSNLRRLTGSSNDTGEYMYGCYEKNETEEAEPDPEAADAARRLLESHRRLSSAHRTSILAPFWSDTQTSWTGNAGQVWYRQVTDESHLNTAQQVINDVGAGIQVSSAFVTTWNMIRAFGGSYSSLNTFQCLLMSDGIRTFAAFIYDRQDWVHCFRGMGTTAINAGDGVNSLEPVPDVFTDRTTTSNVGIPGLYFFRIDALELQDNQVWDDPLFTGCNNDAPAALRPVVAISSDAVNTDDGCKRYSCCGLKNQQKPHTWAKAQCYCAAATP